MLDLPRYRVPRLLSFALPRTASFQLGSTAYRVFSTRPYRVPRLFSWTLPRTASLQKRTTAYRVYSGTYRFDPGHHPAIIMYAKLPILGLHPGIILRVKLLFGYHPGRHPGHLAILPSSWPSCHLAIILGRLLDLDKKWIFRIKCAQSTALAMKTKLPEFVTRFALSPGMP